MASTPVELILGVSGLGTLTLKLYPRGDNSIANGVGDDMTEQARLGCYQAIVTETLDGIYEAYIYSGSNLIYTGFVYLEDDTNIYTIDAVSELVGKGIDIDGKTLQEAIRYVAAICAGKISGAGTGTEEFVGLDGVTRRVTVTVDNLGNRTAVSYD